VSDRETERAFDFCFRVRTASARSFEEIILYMQVVGESGLYLTVYNILTVYLDLYFQIK
jgi:hypothetical protein